MWIAGTTRRRAKNGRRSAFKPIAFNSSTRARSDGGGESAAAGDDELGGPPAAVREPVPRRAPATGLGVPRGQGNDSGPGRPSYPSTTNPISRPATEPKERDQEDIPF